MAIIPWLELDRFVGARDPAAGNELVAAGCIFSKQMTFPGGLVQPVAGVSWIGVRPGWRRRGLLRGLMTAQLHGLHDSGGEAVAILTASEAGLYGRFGYGQSINRQLFQVAHGAAFHAGVGTDNVIEIRADRAPDIVKPLVCQGGCDPSWVPGQDRRSLGDAVLRSRAAAGRRIEEALGRAPGRLCGLPGEVRLDGARAELLAAGRRDLCRHPIARSPRCGGTCSTST